MEIIAFTLVAVALYVIANWIVERIEIARGERLAWRSLLFFFILASLALPTFWLLGDVLNR